MTAHVVQAQCPTCRATYSLTVNLAGMDKIGIRTLADWYRVNGVKPSAGAAPVTCWSCCHAQGIGARPTSGRSWQK